MSHSSGSLLAVGLLWLFVLAGCQGLPSFGPCEPDADVDCWGPAGEDAEHRDDADGGGSFEGNPDRPEVPLPDDPIGGHDPGECEPICLNGEEDEVPGLDDCETVECLARIGCCLNLGDELVGELGVCSSLTGCGLATTAGSPAGSVAVDAAGALVLSGRGVGQVGAVSLLAVRAGEEPRVRVVAALGGEGSPCDDEGGCPQVMGVGLTPAGQGGSSLGLAPAAGIVLDGESGLVTLLVAGRAVESFERGVAALREPHAFGLQVRGDGRVAFWVDSEGEGEPDHVSVTALAPASELELAIFGRVDGPRGGRIESLSFRKRVCDVPDGFARVRASPVFGATGAGARLGRPAVIRQPTLEDAPFLMVFERDRDLGVATSLDGVAWELASEQAMIAYPKTRYGVQGRRAPTLAYWGPEGEDEKVYHLWFEGVSQDPGNPAAIVHAVSLDGIRWTEPPEGSIAIEPGLAGLGNDRLSDPSVVVEPNGSLSLWFLRTNEGTGVTLLARAVSVDGKTWDLGLDAVRLDPDSPATFDRDGVSSPAVARRGNVVHLWYVGHAGARSAIGYAVLDDRRDSPVFRRLGPVFTAVEPWEHGRVGAPAVLVTSGAGGAAELATVWLWYEAGALGAEAIGLATRQVPGRPVPVPDDR